MLTEELTIEDILEVQVRDAREMALEEGREEGQAELVRNFFEFGMAPEQISLASKLPLETVMRLAGA